MTTHSTEIITKPINELTTRFADWLTDLAQKKITTQGYFSLVLTGGKTPKLFYEKLTEEPYKSDIPWQYTSIFWGDERMVPYSDTRSNAGMAHDTLLDHVTVPLNNIFPMPVNIDPLEKAARSYRMTIRKFFETVEPEEAEVDFPSFDLILLGIGSDGHCASLFPNRMHKYATEDRLVFPIAPHHADPPVKRLTLSLQLINAAKNIAFIVTGFEKRSVLESLLKKDAASKHYPASLIEPKEKLVWFTDQQI